MVSTLGLQPPSHSGPPTFHGFISGPYLIGFETNESSLDLQWWESCSEVWRLVLTSFTQSIPNDYNRSSSVDYISNKSDSRHYITFGLQLCQLSREKTRFGRLRVWRSVIFARVMWEHFDAWKFWSSARIAVESSSKVLLESMDEGMMKSVEWLHHLVMSEGSMSMPSWVENECGWWPRTLTFDTV